MLSFHFSSFRYVRRPDLLDDTSFFDSHLLLLLSRFVLISTFPYILIPISYVPSSFTYSAPFSFHVVPPSVGHEHEEEHVGK